MPWVCRWEDRTQRVRFRRLESSTKWTGKVEWFIPGIFVQIKWHCGRIYMVRQAVRIVMMKLTMNHASGSRRKVPDNRDKCKEVFWLSVKSQEKQEAVFAGQHQNNIWMQVWSHDFQSFEICKLQSTTARTYSWNISKLNTTGKFTILIFFWISFNLRWIIQTRTNNEITQVG